MRGELERREEERVCGRCQYHRKDQRQDSGWICLNTDSDCYLDETGYSDRCPDFEPRAQKRF